VNPKTFGNCPEYQRCLNYDRMSKVCGENEGHLEDGTVCGRRELVEEWYKTFKVKHS